MRNYSLAVDNTVNKALGRSQFVDGTTALTSIQEPVYSKCFAALALDR